MTTDGCHICRSVAVQNNTHDPHWTEPRTHRSRQSTTALKHEICSDIIWMTWGRFDKCWKRTLCYIQEIHFSNIVRHSLNILCLTNDLLITRLNSSKTPSSQAHQAVKHTSKSTNKASSFVTTNIFLGPFAISDKDVLTTSLHLEPSKRAELMPQRKPLRGEIDLHGILVWILTLEGIELLIFCSSYTRFSLSIQSLASFSQVSWVENSFCIFLHLWLHA